MPLTPTEKRVLVLYAEGNTGKEIARLMGGRSHRTTEVHIAKVRAKYGAKANTPIDIIVRAIAIGDLSPAFLNIADLKARFTELLLRRAACVKWGLGAGASDGCLESTPTQASVRSS